MSAIMTIQVIRPKYLPVGIILGAKAAATFTDAWIDFTDADEYFLKGTDSDVTVGDTIEAVDAVITSGAGGAHTSGGTSFVNLHGQTGSGGTAPNGWNNATYGNHDHETTLNHIPDKNKLKLIQSIRPTGLPTGGVVFSTAALVGSDPLDEFNNSDGLIQAATATESEAGSSGFTVASGNIGNHDHDTLYNVRVNIGVSTAPVDIGAPSVQVHSHAMTGTITSSIKKVMVRAWELTGASTHDDIIGMWVGQGVPDEWELATEFNDRCIGNDASATGEQSGDDTVSATATSDTVSHKHPTSGSNYDVVGQANHTSNVGHNHELSGSDSLILKHFLIKFIRYTGA